MKTDVRVFVFDFDGTLVDSNQGKRDAFFELFEQDSAARAIVAQVLDEAPEASRYQVLGLMLVRLHPELPAAEVKRQVTELAERYDERVTRLAVECDEIPGARHMLEVLADRHPLYLSSNTPDTSLRRILAQRGWEHYFKGISGFPSIKAATLRGILAAEGVTAPELLVFGDGESDRAAAAEVGCGFLPAGSAQANERLLASLGHVSH